MLAHSVSSVSTSTARLKRKKKKRRKKNSIVWPYSGFIHRRRSMITIIQLRKTREAKRVFWDERGGGEYNVYTNSAHIVRRGRGMFLVEKKRIYQTSEKPNNNIQPHIMRQC